MIGIGKSLEEDLTLEAGLAGLGILFILIFGGKLIKELQNLRQLWSCVDYDELIVAGMA